MVSSGAVGASTAAFVLHGPNGGNGARPRRPDPGQLMTAPGERLQVLDTSPSFALGRFAQWVGAHAPAGRGRVGLWHMRTWRGKLAPLLLERPGTENLEPAACGACASMCVRARGAARLSET